MFTSKHWSYYSLRWYIPSCYHYPKGQGINYLLQFSLRDKILRHRVSGNISQDDRQRGKHEAAQSFGLHYTKEVMTYQH